ncbi:uncharacterized protein LOC126905580 [Daktulosphaira vitifoliae]|uniref:uncharacterized protein LOC126905580 n=1 Tax=Daktulosphaira vitifoliae TaxID=58002 RepID=UPI0021AAF259|nr:uncharacterized protein LOC126905580 [Daktulosphaira vitifoliae]
MKIAKVCFIYLITIAVIKCDHSLRDNADNLEIPRNIAEKIQYIVEIFEQWAFDLWINRKHDKEKFIIYFKHFGQRIAHILSLTSKHNIWWLWQLNILLNSVDEFYEPIKYLEINIKTYKMINKMNRISNVITLIKNQMKLNYDKTKKKSGLLNCFKNTKKLTNQELLQIQLTVFIDEIPSKLKILDEEIEKEYGNINDTSHIFTPQNIFLFDIILNDKSLQTIFKNCTAITFKYEYKEHLKKTYHDAINKWVDIDEKYSELIKYRNTLFGVIKFYIHIHVGLLISIFYGYKCENKGNIQKLNPLWESMKNLVIQFIDFFHFQDDSDLNKIFVILTKYNELPRSSIIQNIYQMTKKYFEYKHDMYKLQYNLPITDFTEQLREGEYLIPQVNQYLKDLKSYFNIVNDLFKNVNFKVYEVFYSLIPKKDSSYF